jgi:hypothetical protein
VDRLRTLCALCVAAAGLLLVAGCRDHAKPKSSVVAGDVRVGAVTRLRSPPLRSCLRRFRLRPSPETLVVERHGLLGSSVTIADPRSPFLYGCDLAGHGRGGRVCGGSVGVWRRGRLNDPRLDILCADRKGRRLGAAWIVPLRRARSILVREGAVTERYPVARRLPVRIWTRDGVDVGRSSATFDVTQLEPGGGRLAHERLRAMVAG